ncbi:terpenoid synthase [Tothia fuscella]|uniref:Terpenoid synthase n=1 Tax=Tothia fuscella TaxID=1048955 RepID=A0A9P4TS49_9PEZI|nr:terpenoid synthase [Tothia fuscella]
MNVDPKKLEACLRKIAGMVVFCWVKANMELTATLSIDYSPFYALNIYRSIADFFNSSWMEQYRFSGYQGAHEYPDYLHRLNGFGDGVGGTIFPVD